MIRHADGYWAETVVRSPDAGGEWHLGGHWAASPEGALAWMRGQAERLATALDPPADPRGPFPTTVLAPVTDGSWSPGLVFAEWATDLGYQQVQRRALREGRPVSVNTRGPDRLCGLGHVEVHYSLSARPIHRHTTARRLLRAA
ncbi:hypothetical protein [Streptomyces bohaiensis]|uniref:Uncharacterized protein n=1 Tax=Streptomyces bohaiensis TaxID=1431344 RepID=A0ABX1CA16_9ACTN|nr:hypothetical protein [Streptomyces bohaiensis]NJQ14455.1 hypothetical protein [Streptomyces bohaiensis]